MTISIQKIAVFCGSYKKHNVSYSVIMLSKNLSSLSDISMMSPEMLIHVSLCSGVSLAGTKWWQRRRMLKTSWRILWQLRAEISNLRCNLVHRFPSVTSRNLAHARHLLHLLTLMGDHYADHHQWSRVCRGNVMPFIRLKLFHCSVTIHLLQHGWCLRWWFLQRSTQFDIRTLLNYKKYTPTTRLHVH